MQTKCSTHQKDEQGYRQCLTCKRIAVEARVVKKVIDTLLLAGYELATDADADDGELTYSVDRKGLYERMRTVDDERLYARKQGSPTSFVYFVYGNEGWDVVNDHGISLSCYLDPILDWADKKFSR